MRMLCVDGGCVRSPRPGSTAARGGAPPAAIQLRWAQKPSRHYGTPSLASPRPGSHLAASPPHPHPRPRAGRGPAAPRREAQARLAAPRQGGARGRRRRRQVGALEWHDDADGAATRALLPRPDGPAAAAAAPAVKGLPLSSGGARCRPRGPAARRPHGCSCCAPATRHRPRQEQTKAGPPYCRLAPAVRGLAVQSATHPRARIRRAALQPPRSPPQPRPCARRAAPSLMLLRPPV
jgi:hypothetical protein